MVYKFMANSTSFVINRRQVENLYLGRSSHIIQFCDLLNNNCSYVSVYGETKTEAIGPAKNYLISFAKATRLKPQLDFRPEKIPLPHVIIKVKYGYNN
jgi:hypothetical protein